jgi:hypothetical protein
VHEVHQEERMMKKINLYFLLCLMITGFACKDMVEQPPDKTFTLTVEDASCTEVYLSLKIGAGINSRTVTLKRDTITLFTRTIDAAQTAITDTSLLPGHTYNYTAQLINASTASSSTARTMDTTSHSWTFNTTLLGDGSGSSALFDVAIIGDTAWAVGEIYIGGSIFNAAMWDGTQWELKKIPFIGSCSAVDFPSIFAIWVFSNNNILFSNGGSIVTYDGTNAVMDCRMNSLLTGAIRKIFAFNPQDIYIVGNTGAVLHYNGSNWTKIESGTGLNINDVWGDYNASTGQNEILGVATNIFIGPDKAIIKIDGLNAQLISTEGVIGNLSSVWFKSNEKYYVAGGGTYEKNNLNDLRWANGEYDISIYSISKIRGNGLNDIVSAGGYGEVLHFNGISWKSYLNITQLNNGNYSSVAIKNNLMIAVGADIPKAVVLMGRR